MGAAETFVVCLWSQLTMMKLRFSLASLFLIHMPNPILKTNILKKGQKIPSANIRPIHESIK